MHENNRIHDIDCFKKESLQSRMGEYGFKNMSRMELFLWDLELFQQIQRIAGDRVVLKGGAAVQFYYPKECQRTSVDIDMIFFGSEDDVSKLLSDLETRLGAGDGLFRFRKHIPKKPKTTLPLLTYFVDVPSVLFDGEMNSGEEVPHQELKLEFILKSEMPEYEMKTGENIFAVNSKFKYRLLPINTLFADKLTTMGAETIGVQNGRMDEQVKQFYDVWMLTVNCISLMDSSVVLTKYRELAEVEWYTRKGEAHDINLVIADVNKQLSRYERVDSGEDAELKKYINDFRSLYLSSRVNFSIQDVACGASQVRLMYNLLVEGKSWTKMAQTEKILTMMDLKEMSGSEKGATIREIRARLIKDFGNVSLLPASDLRGKSLRRIFWSIAGEDNLDAIEKSVSEIILSVQQVTVLPANMERII